MTIIFFGQDVFQVEDEAIRLNHSVRRLLRFFRRRGNTTIYCDLDGAYIVKWPPKDLSRYFSHLITNDGKTIIWSYEQRQNLSSCRYQDGTSTIQRSFSTATSILPDNAQLAIVPRQCFEDDRGVKTQDGAWLEERACTGLVVGDRPEGQLIVLLLSFAHGFKLSEEEEKKMAEIRRDLQDKDEPSYKRLLELERDLCRPPS